MSTASTSELYKKMASSIIKDQEKIIGPMAWIEAKKVRELVFDGTKISTLNNGKVAVQKLVNRFEQLFGQASIEVCRNAVRTELTQLVTEDIPESLR